MTTLISSARTGKARPLNLKLVYPAIQIIVGYTMTKRTNDDVTPTEHGLALDLARDDYYTGETTARCECCDARVTLDTMAPGIGGYAHCHACINACVHCGTRLATHEDRDGNQACEGCRSAWPHQVAS